MMLIRILFGIHNASAALHRADTRIGIRANARIASQLSVSVCIDDANARLRTRFARVDFICPCPSNTQRIADEPSRLTQMRV